jgi:hypothetical protein
MQQEGKKIYLDISEQLATEYPSPLDLETFPLHEQREAVDGERDRLEAMTFADDDELTHSERAALPARLDRIRQKSEILREIARLSALESMINGVDS